MDPPSASDPEFEALRAAVLERALEGEPEQALLDAAVGLGATAAVLWRRLDVPRRSDGALRPRGWFPVRTRGATSPFPSDAVLAAAFDGGLSCGLPHGALVLGGRPLALGLAVAGLERTDGAETSEAEARADLLEALVAVVAQLEQLEEEEAGSPGGLESLDALLPGLLDSPGWSDEEPGWTPWDDPDDGEAWRRPTQEQRPAEDPARPPDDPPAGPGAEDEPRDAA